MEAPTGESEEEITTNGFVPDMPMEVRFGKNLMV